MARVDHPANGKQYRVIKGEIGWRPVLEPEADFEVATVMRVNFVGDRLVAYCRVVSAGGRAIACPAFFVEDLEGCELL